MPDIELRFGKDMLVLSSPIDATLSRQGLDVERDRQYLNLMEPDIVRDAYRLEDIAGAQCFVTPTEDLTQARLAHVRMDGDAAKLAHAAVTAISELKPQHILAEIGPCRLPLDASSKASLNENRAQYADAAHAFAAEPIDALFLNGFTNLADLKCALMGVAQVCDKPVFASVTVGEAVEQDAREAQKDASDESVLESIAQPALFSGYEVADVPSFPQSVLKRAPLSPDKWGEAVDIMQEFGAAVVGFETAEPTYRAVSYVQEAAQRTHLPILAQLRLTIDPSTRRPAPLKPLEDILEYTPDTLASAAVKLYGAGAQFLRATGKATPACSGALAAAVYGLDVRPRA